MPQPAVLNENVAQSIIELIGNTPLLQLNRFAANKNGSSVVSVGEIPA